MFQSLESKVVSASSSIKVRSVYILSVKPYLIFYCKKVANINSPEPMVLFSWV